MTGQPFENAATVWPGRLARASASDSGWRRSTPDQPDEWIAQLVSCPIPTDDIETLKSRLYDEFRVEVPLGSWNGHNWVRVSFQGYNDESDLDRLIEALEACI